MQLIGISCGKETMTTSDPTENFSPNQLAKRRRTRQTGLSNNTDSVLLAVFETLTEDGVFDDPELDPELFSLYEPIQYVTPSRGPPQQTVASLNDSNNRKRGYNGTAM